LHSNRKKALQDSIPIMEYESSHIWEGNPVSKIRISFRMSQIKIYTSVSLNFLKGLYVSKIDG
jgi:hypothetical protein